MDRARQIIQEKIGMYEASLSLCRAFLQNETDMGALAEEADRIKAFSIRIQTLRWLLQDLG